MQEGPVEYTQFSDENVATKTGQPAFNAQPYQNATPYTGQPASQQWSEKFRKRRYHAVYRAECLRNLFCRRYLRRDPLDFKCCSGADSVFQCRVSRS